MALRAHAAGPFLLPVENATEGRIDVAGGAPFAGKTVEVVRFRIRAWVEVEAELFL